MKKLSFTKEEKQVLYDVISSFNDKDMTFKEGSLFDKIEKKLQRHLSTLQKAKELNSSSKKDCYNNKHCSMMDSNNKCDDTECNTRVSSPS